MPNFNHLKNHFSSVYNIPIDNILIFKYAISSAKWYQLSSGMKNPLKGKKKSSFYNSKTENILLPPYSLRDGDLLAIIDISSSSELIVSPLLLDYDDDKNQQETTSMNNNDRSVYTIQNDLHLDRYEDIYLRWLKNEENVEKKIKAKNMPGGKKKQIVEISLKFGGDLDFSSEEEEEGENDDS